MGENHFEKNPVALYGINLLFCAIAFLILEKSAIKHEGKNSKIGKAIQSNTKEFVSILLYIIGVVSSYFYPTIGIICYALVAIMWIIPDSRIEKQLK